MARVSLILPLAPNSSPCPDRIRRLREGLDGVGYEVEALAVSDSRTVEGMADARGTWRSLSARIPGLAASAVIGLMEARGDLLVVLDPERGYSPDDICRALEPLTSGEADVVVARRGGGGGVRGRLRDLAGAMIRPWLGASGLRPGLVAMTRSQARAAEGDFSPVGSLFALELLLRTGGRRLEVPIAGESPGRPGWLTLDEIRHLKRLADDRYGNLSRLIQFCLVGASGMVVDLGSYALFQWVFARTRLAQLSTPLLRGPLDLAAAGALAILLGLTWNFSLNRRLTFNYARRGSFIHQYVSYTLSNALGIALSFALRLLLPRHFSFFQQHKLAAALVGIVAATGISFSMSRWVVFRHDSVAPESTGRDADAILVETSPAP